MVADTLLPTQMFPRLPARGTFVADIKSVSDFVQKHFVSATNVFQFAQHGNTTFILCPARLRARENHEQQCVRNNVSATMCPCLPGPLRHYRCFISLDIFQSKYVGVKSVGSNI